MVEDRGRKTEASVRPTEDETIQTRSLSELSHILSRQSLLLGSTGGGGLITGIPADCRWAYAFLEASTVSVGKGLGLRIRAWTLRQTLENRRRSGPSPCHGIEESPEKIGQFLGRLQLKVLKNRRGEGSVVELGVTRLPK